MERFWNKVERSETCWKWLASTDTAGYGEFRLNKTMVRAHRMAWLLVKDEVLPSEVKLHHTCGNRWCVNPEHLTPVTQGEHNRIHGNRITHCVNGHEFTPENTYVRPGRTSRSCRKCNVELSRSSARKRRAAYLKAGFTSEGKTRQRSKRSDAGKPRKK